jgi:hypothetical protein
MPVTHARTSWIVALGVALGLAVAGAATIVSAQSMAAHEADALQTLRFIASAQMA